jgi:hypothetical protein
MIWPAASNMEWSPATTARPVASQSLVKIGSVGKAGTTANVSPGLVAGGSTLAKTPKAPAGLSPAIKNSLPTNPAPAIQASIQATINSTRTSVDAAYNAFNASPATFNPTRLTNELKAAEGRFSSMPASTAQQAAFDALVAKGRGVLGQAAKRTPATTLQAVAAMVKRATVAKQSNSPIFDAKRFANSLKAAEQVFATMKPSDAQKKQMAVLVQNGTQLLPGVEKAPPDLPTAPGGTTDDHSKRAGAAGLAAKALNAATNQARGTLVDTQKHKADAKGLDGNSDFNRVIGTANSNKLPVYQAVGTGNSYLMPIDLSKVSLMPSAERSGSTIGTDLSKQPNPLYKNSRVSDFAAAATAKGIDGKKLLAAFNSAYFNTYGSQTTISHASLINGVVTSTGKVEPGKKMLVSWNNRTQEASIKPWAANSAGGFYSGANGTGWKLASPAAVKKEFGAAVGDKDASGFIGFDAKSDKSNEAKAGTYVGISKAGKLAVFVVGDNMKTSTAVQYLTKAGYGAQVMKLDAGPSSQLALVTTRLKVTDYQSSTDRLSETMVGSILDRPTPMPIGIVEKP